MTIDQLIQNFPIFTLVSAGLGPRHRDLEARDRDQDRDLAIRDRDRDRDQQNRSRDRDQGSRPTSLVSTEFERAGKSYNGCRSAGVCTILLE